MKKKNDQLPTYEDLMNPLIKALRDLGGSGSIEEIYEQVTEILHLPEEMLGQLHNPETGNRTEIGYRLAWARTYLKKYGILENSSRGVWSISPNKTNVKEVDPKEVSRFVIKLTRSREFSRRKGTKEASRKLQKRFNHGERPYITYLLKNLTQQLLNV